MNLQPKIILTGLRLETDISVDYDTGKHLRGIEAKHYAQTKWGVEIGLNPRRTHIAIIIKNDSALYREGDKAISDWVEAAIADTLANTYPDDSYYNTARSDTLATAPA